MRIMVFVTFALVAGCASSMERVQAVRDGAPAWFDARKSEIAGNDYPSIADVPSVDGRTMPGQRLDVSEAETEEARRLFQTDPRAKGPEETGDSMLAWAAEARRVVDRQDAAADFLTDEDIAELRAVFDTPRGR